MITIESERLILRNFQVDDWRELQELIRLYQASEYAQYDHPWPTGDAETQSIAAWFAGGDDYLAVCLNPGGELIGLVAIEPRQDQIEAAHNLVISSTHSTTDRGTPLKPAAWRWITSSAGWGWCAS